MKSIRLIFLGAIAAPALFGQNAQIPQKLNYQGRVSVQGVNFNGVGQFRFAIVDGGYNQNQTATAYTNTDGNSITFIGIINFGSGYTTPPVVTISAPDGPAGGGGGGGGGSSINGCSATQNGGIGIIAAYGVVVSNCCSAYNTNSGIVAHGGSVSNCAARKNGEHGISAYDASISHCTADSNNTRNLSNRFGIEGYFSTISFCVSTLTLGGNDYSPPINTAGATWFNCR
jgi:hypothetical protein